MPLDHPALIRANVRKIGRIERAELDDLLGEALHAARRPVCVDQLDAPPAVPGARLEDRADLDFEARLFEDLTRHRILDPFAGVEKSTEAAPFRRPEAVPREEHAPVRIHSKSDDATEEDMVRSVK